MEYPKRKSTRLKGYDYSQNGVYFVTVCTYKKQKLLSEIVGEGFHALPNPPSQIADSTDCDKFS